MHDKLVNAKTGGEPVFKCTSFDNASHNDASNEKQLFNLIRKRKMKNTIFAILTVLGFNTAFAECNNAPYVAPVELQPSCAKEPVKTATQAGPALESAKAEIAVPSTPAKSAENAANPKKKPVAHTVKQPLE